MGPKVITGDSELFGSRKLMGAFNCRKEESPLITARPVDGKEGREEGRKEGRKKERKGKERKGG